MNMRQLRRRQAARTVRSAAAYTSFATELLFVNELGVETFFHDDDGTVHDRTCRFCDGTGGDRWNDGVLPCEHCDGEGYEWWK